MLEQLKNEVLAANLELKKNGLVLFTWGNVSAIDRASGLIVIKPSGVSYEDMKPQDMVVVDMYGKVVEGTLRPSSDTPTHAALYRAFPQLGGIVHTHSTFATAFAQACRAIPAYGTTHADYFYGDIPCTRSLTGEEMADYEANTGKVIAETVKREDVLAVPACLAANHGVFAWGKTAAEAVYHATVVEEVAKMAYLTEGLSREARRLPQHIADKHYFRKHGKDAYYGQPSSPDGDKK